MFIFLASFFALFAPVLCCFGDTARLPRTIVVLFDSRFESSPDETAARRFVESPLNHLGLRVKYIDVSGIEKFSEVESPEVRGIVTAFPFGAVTPQPGRLLNYLSAAVEAKKNVVLLGEVSFLFGAKQNSEEGAKAAQIAAYLGLQYGGRSAFVHPDIEVGIVDPAFLSANAVIEPVLWRVPVITQTFQSDRLVVSGRLRELSPRHPFVRQQSSPALALVSILDHGGVALGPWAFAEYTGSGPAYERRSWFIDPLRFFSATLKLTGVPRPDVTTFSGRRIFTAVADGPGLLATATSDGLLTGESGADVLCETFLKRRKNIIFTVAPVAAEIDERWVGTPNSIRAARSIFALPNVRVATSGYSNVWNFQAYEVEPGDTTRGRMGTVPISPASQDAAKNEPRQYSTHPFSLEREIKGAIEKVREVAQKGTDEPIPVILGEQSLLSASLDEFAKKEGVSLVTGGRSRLDPRFPSAAWLEPVTAPMESSNGYRTIYPLGGERAFSSIPNQPEYSYQFARATLLGTESPIRFRPFALRFGIDAGQSNARRRSLEILLDLAETQELIPMSLAKYTGVVSGFQGLQLEWCGADCWKIFDRQGLGTVRFDDADGKRVDYFQSKGVTGARNFQGALYVSLDPAESEPVVVLSSAEAPSPIELIDSNCFVSKVVRSDDAVSFDAQCDVDGIFTWKIPWNDFTVAMEAQEEGSHVENVEGDSNGNLQFTIPAGRTARSVTIAKRIPRQ